MVSKTARLLDAVLAFAERGPEERVRGGLANAWIHAPGEHQFTSDQLAILVEAAERAIVAR